MNERVKLKKRSIIDLRCQLKHRNSILISKTPSSLRKCIGKYNRNNIQCETCLFREECKEVRSKMRIRKLKE